MVSETTRFLRRALAGEEIAYAEYPFCEISIISIAAAISPCLQAKSGL
jgi:hypothetical protein